MPKDQKQQYFLGIDGGASKTEFLLVDQNLKAIHDIKIEEGSNPWHHGVEQANLVLEKGFKSLGPKILKKVVFVYAGISGCFGDSKYNDQIKLSINRFVNKVEVHGDLYSSFRAQAKGKYGLLAIAGTGSVVANFDESGTNYFDGPAFGGRDFGYLICRSLVAGYLDDKKYLKAFLERNIDVEYLKCAKDLREWMKYKELTNLAVLLSSQDSSSRVFNDLRIFLDIVVDRWVYKIYAYALKYNHNQRTKFELVLSGNFWRFKYIRESVIKQLRNYLPNAQVRYSEKIRPVMGCVRLAKEYYQGD